MSEGTVPKEAIRQVPLPGRVAFSAACIEHALPLYERTTARDDLRAALDYLWMCGAGGAAAPGAIADLHTGVGSAIPDSEEDGGDRVGAMHRAVGCAVLEGLDVVSGNAEAAVRVAYDVLDAIDVASLLFRPGTPSPDVSDPPEIRDELSVQRQLVADLSRPEQRDWRAFRERQQEWGRELLSRFR